ncbi:MAG: hypothetical protein MK052_09855 [Alphaproteobacteria bacterium]|nr:hypothetical protein [Alphaproteobacteria bacterium]
MAEKPGSVANFMRVAASSITAGMVGTFGVEMAAAGAAAAEMSMASGISSAAPIVAGALGGLFGVQTMRRIDKEEAEEAKKSPEAPAQDKVRAQGRGRSLAQDGVAPKDTSPSKPVSEMPPTDLKTAAASAKAAITAASS